MPFGTWISRLPREHREAPHLLALEGQRNWFCGDHRAAIPAPQQLRRYGLALLFIVAVTSISILEQIFGTTGLVNFAHGEFTVAAMYAAFLLFTLFGVDPLIAIRAE